MSPVIGVLAIQGDVREHARCLEQLDVDVRLVKTAEQLKGIAGLVIPGGESTTMSILAVKTTCLGHCANYELRSRCTDRAPD